MSTFEESFSRTLAEGFAKRQDGVIRQAMVEAGLNPDDKDFIKEHCQIVQCVGDTFDHFYYHAGQPDQKRIISIQREPEINIGWNDREVTKEIYRQSVSAKYY